MASFYFLSLLLPFLSTVTGSNIVGEENSGQATVALRSSVRWIGPGQTFYLIVVLTPDDDWHVYWKNPGDSGMPTEFEVWNLLLKEFEHGLSNSPIKSSTSSQSSRYSSSSSYCC